MALRILMVWPPDARPCIAGRSSESGLGAEESLQPEALGAVQEVTNGLKHSEKRISLEIQRAARAAT